MNKSDQQPDISVYARDFLASVVPWNSGGYITVHRKLVGVKEGLPGQSCRTLDEALQVIAKLQDGPRADIYFCLSSQKLNSGKRSRDNALALGCVWVDIDVDPDDPKKYNSVAEALASLIWFCDQHGIPRPSFVVASGGGLHAYWLSDRVLTVEEWQIFADALKEAAKAAGLKFDAGVTGDAARVLRVPGTLNWKYPDGPRPVRLLQSAVHKLCNGIRHDFAVAFGKLLAKTDVPPRSPRLEVSPAFARLDTSRNVAEGIVVPEAQPLPFAPVREGCAWLRTAYETGGKTFSEPQWNLSTLTASFLIDGSALAHKFGDQHPGYSFESTEKKLEEKIRARETNKDIGWPQCKTIHEAQLPGPSLCEQCPQFAKGKSPLNLGYEAAKDESDNEELGLLGGTRPPDLRLPEGFCLNEDGIVCAFIASTTTGKNNKVVPPRLLPLLMVKIKDPSLQFQNGHFGLGFVATTDRNGEQQIFLNSANVYAPGLFTELAKRCVLFCPDKPARASMEMFAVSWLKKLLDEDTAIRDSGTMGWRYEDGNLIGFVYGDALHRENGTTIQIVAGADDELRKWYAPVGRRETWVRAARLLTDRKRPELDCLVSIAFAAPLMVFTGATYGAILSVWGDPGTSKSTAQQVAAAVWGHPKQTRESLNSTPKSVQGRLGRTRNLAAYWDDVQDERHQEGLFQTMFVAAEGTEGGRLNPDASYKQRLDWQTMLVACSNASFVEYLIKKQRSTTAGMRRVFEFEFNKDPHEPGMINALDASTIFAELEHNYGGIGLEYARMLAQEHKEIKTLVAGMLNEFTETVAGVGDESFWLSTCGCLLAGATLANRLGAELDVPAMRAFLIDAYHYNRKIRGTEGTEGGSLANTEQSLAAFLNAYTGGGHAIFIDKLFVHPKIKVGVLRHPETSRTVYVQVVRDQRLIIVSKREMRDYFGKREIQARQVFDGLVRYFNAQERRYTLGANTVYAQAQEWCFEIPVRDDQPLLYDLLTAWGEPEA